MQTGLCAERTQNYQKYYHKNLKDSHSKTLLSNNDLIIYLLDDDCCLLEFNNRFSYWFEAIYGIEPIVGMSIFEGLECTLVGETKEWKSRYEEVISLGKKRKFVDIFKSDGKHYNSSVSLFPVINNGKTTQIAAFVKNVNVEIANERAACPLGNDFQQLVEPTFPTLIFQILYLIKYLIIKALTR
ncbi:MAG: hypothetical protein ACJAWV_003175 [Flammeovirgaceae bacterium]|jgi:hypothetical protein